MHIRTRISSTFQQGALKWHALMMSVMIMFEVYSEHLVSCPLSKVGRLYEHQNSSAIPNPGSKVAELEDLEKTYSPTHTFPSL